MPLLYARDTSAAPARLARTHAGDDAVVLPFFNTDRMARECVHEVYSIADVMRAGSAITGARR